MADSELKAAVRDLTEGIRDAHPGVELEMHVDPVGDWVLDKIIVPDDRRRAGLGTEIMAAITAAADAAGARMTVTPSIDFGGTLTRLTAFYGRFDFVRNAGRNKDYSTRQTMLRAPAGA